MRLTHGGWALDMVDDVALGPEVVVPEGAKKPMVRDDPRQGTPFAAEYARAVHGIAAAAGGEALALAAPAGPFAATAALRDFLEEVGR